MKLISIIFISTILFQSFLCKDQFEIISATGQDWKGGQKQTGYGTNYEINILTKTNSGHLVFDKLWIGKKYFEISCFQKGKKMKNNTFGPGDTVTIQVNDRTVPEPLPFIDKQKVLSIENDTPDYKGEALLSYMYKEKRHYIEIEEFTRLEAQYYP